MDVIYFLLLIGPLVFAHELGHFLTAKAFGIRVLKFSLGFGRVLVGWQYGETYYQIAWIPLGGFVKFLGDDPRDEADVPEEDLKYSWNSTARWKRAIVVFAGPMMSLLFPVFCYFSIGLFQSELDAAAIGQVVPGTPAARAGLQAGDRVTKIDGENVHGFIDLKRIVSARPEKEMDLVVRRGDEDVTVKIRPARVKVDLVPFLDITDEVGQIGVELAFPGPVVGVPDEASPAGKAGLRTFDRITRINGTSVKRWLEVQAVLADLEPGQEVEVSYLRSETTGWAFADVNVQQPGQATLVVDEAPELGNGTGLELASTYLAYTIEDMPGHANGLRAGDKVIAHNGQPIELWTQFHFALRENPSEPRQLTVLRGGEELTIRLQLERRYHSNRYAGEVVDYRAGVGPYLVREFAEPVANPNRVTRAAFWAVEMTLQKIELMAVGLLRMVQGRVSLSSIGGPIMLFELAGTAGRQGAGTFLEILALISVNLGLLNLLPIPVLDGGHLMFLAIEGIRRKSLSIRAREIANIVGLCLLLLLMVFAFKNDIQRYWDWEDFTGLFH